MADQKTVQIVIEAQAKVDQATKEVQSKLDKLKGSVDNMQPAFKKMAAVGTVALVGLGAVLKKGVDGLIDAEKATRQLENAVVGVSKGTKKQVEEIQALSKSLEKKIGIDADALDIGAAQLSTFGLQSASVVRLTKSLADLTINQKGLNGTADDYISSANTIAKALNGQFGVLEKSGIRFTEAQQKLILYGKESEKVSALMEGLNQNLRETSTTIEGSTEANMAKLTKQMEDMRDNLAKGVLPAFQQVIEKVSTIAERVGAWMEKNPELTNQIVQMGVASLALFTAIGFIGMTIPSIIKGIGLLGTAIKFLTTGAFGPALLVLASFSAAIIAINESIKKFQSLTQSMKTDIQKQQEIQSDVQKLIDKKKAKGEDTTKLENALSQSQQATGESQRYLDSGFLGKVFFKQKTDFSTPKNLSDTMLSADDINTRAQIYNITFNGDINDKDQFAKKIRENLSQGLQLRGSMP